MKRILSYLTTGLFALALSRAALAQAVDPTTKIVRFTGSTAYRAATVKAISNSFDGGNFTVGFVGGSFGGAVAANFRGSIGGVDVLIKTSWTGSEAGLQTVSFGAAPLTVKFLPDAATRGPGTPGTGGGTGGLNDPTAAAAAAADFSAEIPDIAMSDTFQAKSEFFGPYKGRTYPGLTESPNSPVGVVPFQFVASKSAPATVTNVTSQLARSLFGAGKLPLSLFTGLPADTALVFATGRDPDSGTRLTALAETGLGAVASVKQYQPSDGNNVAVTTGGGAITNNVPWPASTVNTIPVAVFNGGYNSGGKLALAMGNTTDAMKNFDAATPPNQIGTGGFYITYLSTGDAGTAVGAGAKTLSYNGVPYSLQALQEGAYTFWGYEHLYYRAGAVGTTVKDVGDKVALQLKTTDATVLTGSMHVSRLTDGGVVDFGQ